ncbi:Isopentenyl-diphosphate Delta-isomerase I, chloroplastic [Dichanthelium oligosanthes]|uniref:Isopentenyl-diphosphate Delta-isomerase I, chloroplastic n=1 Tax=Dichanthelium oligosanthes TaxID=888268 RepID=A0A1E5UIF4_9POAL|nr:Isopentenyl-diphosphate Delta-isomerase I, chloroplastic [Dichanthelium oligosanthes]
MAASAARPLALLASASASLGVGRRARARLAVCSSLAGSALPMLRGRRSLAAAAGGAVMGKAGPGAVDADAGMDSVQRRLMFEDECILVDEQDNVIGHESKYNWVRNAAQRKLFDELGIVADELPVDQFTPLGRMLYKAPSDGKWGEHELDYLLFMVRDVKLNPNPEEVADVKYMNRDQLKELLRKADAGEDGVKLSPWFRLVVDNFLMGWWDHVEQGTLQEAADMKTIHKL